MASSTTTTSSSVATTKSRKKNRTSMTALAWASRGVMGMVQQAQEKNEQRVQQEKRRSAQDKEDDVLGKNLDVHDVDAMTTVASSFMFSAGMLGMDELTVVDGVAEREKIDAKVRSRKASVLTEPSVQQQAARILAYKDDTLDAIRREAVGEVQRGVNAHFDFTAALRR
ncbi:hypothetical protein TeGR_g286, partial [Tetraparma gracilis]